MKKLFLKKTHFLVTRSNNLHEAPESLKNLMLEGVEGGFTVDFTQGDDVVVPIYDAASSYAERDIPLIIVAGKEYGSGSSRDWAAKGTALLGVRAVIAESYERIHRSNLIGMGVLPLQFPEGASCLLYTSDAADE